MIKFIELTYLEKPIFINVAHILSVEACKEGSRINTDLTVSNQTAFLFYYTVKESYTEVLALIAS